MVGLSDYSVVFWGKVEASDEINCLCGLLDNFPPVVICIPSINTKVVSLIIQGVILAGQELWKIVWVQVSELMAGSGV